MSREGKLVKNTFVLSIGTFLPKLATFITMPILTGYLTKEEYGIYDLITILVSLLLPTVTLQIATSAFRFIVDDRDDRVKVGRIVTNLYAFIIPVSLLALVIFLIAYREGSFAVRLWVCLYLFFDIMVNAARQVVRGMSDNMSYSISAIISALGKMIFAVVFVWYLKIGLLGSVIALWAASFFSFIFLVFRKRLYHYISFKNLSMAQMKEMILYSWPMVPNNLSMWIMRVSDRVVVTIFMGVTANAVYSVANKIPSLLNLAQNSFTLAWQENASIVSKDEDASGYYSGVFKVLFDLMAGFFGLLVACTPILFRLLIKGDYSEAYNQIPILFVGMFFFGISTFIGGIYVAYKKTTSIGVTTIAAAMVNLVVNLCAIKFWGLYAASVSTLVSYVLLFIFRLYDVQKIITLKYDLKHIITLVLIMTVQSILCFMQNTYLNIINMVCGIIIFYVLNRNVLHTLLRETLKKVKR